MAEPNWFEREYFPSLSVANAGDIFASWKQRAQATRAKFKFRADLQYGPHVRETLDFYPAGQALGCIVFIHGGYWVEFSKIETSWVADGFIDQHLSVALVNYPLCPEVSISAIRGSCARAFAYLYKNVLSASERANLVVAGHSAGGHLAAAHLVEDWTKFGLPQNPLAGVMPISGVFDVAPLAQTSLNEDLKITRASAEAVDLLIDHPRNEAKLVVALGQRESSEFHRQSAALAKTWSALAPELVDVSGANHFTILESLASPEGELNRLAVAMARR